MRRLGFALVWFLLSAAVVPAQGSAYSTFLGAAGQDEDGELGRVNAIAVDRDGSAYVAGLTRNSGFPTTPGAFNRTYAGPSAFVTKFTPDGSALEYSTLFARGSQVEDIAVDAQGKAYVTGTTGSASFPTTANAYDRSLSGPSDVFVVKLDATGSHLLYSSYLGGADEGGEFAPSIAVGPGGDAYVVG